MSTRPLSSSTTLTSNSRSSYIISMVHQSPFGRVNQWGTPVPHQLSNHHRIFRCKLSQPHFEGNVRSPLTLPKMGLGSPPGLPKTQNSIAGVKTPRIEVFFIPLENVSKCRCPKWPRMSHLNIWNTSYGQKKGRESNWQFDSWPLKVGNQPDFGVCRWNATHRWKALKESYKFSLNLVLIGG
jgi:hypothetical protein